MSETYYRIIDEKGHYADCYSFQPDEQNPFKWYYLSQEGYVWGSVLYNNDTYEIQILLEHLKETSKKYGLHKVFGIVSINKEELGFGKGKILKEEFMI